MAKDKSEALARNIALAALIVLLLVLIFAGPQARGPGLKAAAGRLEGRLRRALGGRRPPPARSAARPPPASSIARPPPVDSPARASSNELIGREPWPGGRELVHEAERASVREALNRLYSTADVDPLVTGQLYAHNGEVRHIYAQRTAYPEDDLEDLAIEQASCRSAYGLSEYNSSWGANTTGVDVGPFGLDEYAGLRSGYDDGIPPNYNLPSTPIRAYKPSQEDYYDPAGLEVYSVGLYALSVPDHDPLVGEDPPTGSWFGSI